MALCAVFGCPNATVSNEPSVLYHPFPKTDISQQWEQACGWQANSIDVNIAHICSLHFEENAYNREIKMLGFEACYTKTLKDDAVPTLYLPHIIIKDDSINLENLKGLVVYTINTKDDNTPITISLQNDTVDKQFFELESSSSGGKADDADKYSHVKGYPDLYLLQAHNKSLKRQIETLENEVTELEQSLETKESEYKKCEEEVRHLETRITNKSMLTQQEQKMILKKVFSESQIKILFGKKKIYWSNDDMAVGYTIRHLSNKRCYAFLMKTMNIPLPAVSSMKRWITTKKGKKPECVKKEEAEQKFALI